MDVRMEEEIQQLKALHLLLTEDEQKFLLASIAAYSCALNTGTMRLEDRVHISHVGKSILQKIRQQLIEKHEE